MPAEQQSLFDHGLDPLTLGQAVWVAAEAYLGTVAQIGHGWYAVYAEPWRGHFSAPLPSYLRDELQAVEACPLWRKPR